jgi:hypothetical protein
MVSLVDRINSDKMSLFGREHNKFNFNTIHNHNYLAKVMCANNLVIAGSEVYHMAA